MANRMEKRIAAATLSDLEEDHESDECDDFSRRQVYSKAFIIITKFFYISIKFSNFCLLCVFIQREKTEPLKQPKLLYAHASL